MEHRASAHLPASFLTWGTVDVLDEATPVAGEPCSLEISLRLNQALTAGQTIEVWVHFVSDIQLLQTDDADQPAAFSCDAPGVEPFVQTDAKVHGPGTFFPYRRYAGIRLT